MPDLLEEMLKQTTIGDPSVFAIGYAFLGDNRCTEISMWAEGTNLLGFTREGCHYTTRWLYLEDLVVWVNNFTLNMAEDPFPIVVSRLWEPLGCFQSESRTLKTNQYPRIKQRVEKVAHITQNHPTACSLQSRRILETA